LEFKKEVSLEDEFSIDGIIEKLGVLKSPVFEKAAALESQIRSFRPLGKGIPAFLQPEFPFIRPSD
jgi:hypothetical protein